MVSSHWPSMHAPCGHAVEPSAQIAQGMSVSKTQSLSAVQPFVQVVGCSATQVPLGSQNPGWYRSSHGPWLGSQSSMLHGAPHARPSQGM
jgi:hypothetical protein